MQRFFNPYLGSGYKSIVGEVLNKIFRFSAGFDFNGKSFALLRVEDKILHAKGKGEGAMYPMTIQMTQQAMVIAIGHHDAFAGSVSAAVGKIADYLEDNGF
jgi:hypothetical protein